MQIETKINPNYALMKSTIKKSEKSELDRLKELDSKKLDENNYGYIYPPVSPILTDYILKHNGRLRTCTEVLAEDTILQDYVFKNINGDNVHDETLLHFWNKRNKYNFYLAVAQKYQYGYDACEITFRNCEPYYLTQIPAKTLVIQKANDTYYAVQMNFNQEIKKFRIYDLLDTYTKEDEELAIVLWLGGSSDYRFYDVPKWYSDKDTALGRINLNILNAEQINNGNNVTGILNITGPPQRPNPVTNKTVEQQLREQMKRTGTGVMVTYLETPDSKFPLNFEFVKISNDNWQYLENYSKYADELFLSNYRIPKVRLMIDDVTESMNSNKSDTIWQIYAISLNYEQYANELVVQDFDNIFFGLDFEVDMQIPIFSDKKQIEIETVMKLFNSALLTLGQAIVKVSEYYPDLHIDEYISKDNPLYNERYYNGNLLGFADTELTESDINEAEQILNIFREL